MSTMNISLPDEMRAWVESQVRGGEFSSASEYFRQLVREARAQKERDERERKKAELEALLIEGLESGPAVPMDKTWWDTLLSDVDEKLKRRGVEGGLGVSTLEELEATITESGMREGAEQKVPT